MLVKMCSMAINDVIHDMRARRYVVQRAGHNGNGGLRSLRNFRRSEGKSILVFLATKISTAMALQKNNYQCFQVRALDIFLAIKSAFGGNKITPTWSGEGTKRLAALTLVTFSLLVLRLHVMGSKLPVFTR